MRFKNCIHMPYLPAHTIRYRAKKSADEKPSALF